MAKSLAELTSDRRPSFVKYVVDNPRWNQIEFEIMPDVSAVLYANTAKNPEVAGSLKEGTRISMVDKRKYEVDGKPAAKIRTVLNNKVGYVQLRMIRKPTPKISVAAHYETEAADILNEEFRKIGHSVTVVVNGISYPDMCFAVQVDKALKSRMRTGGWDPKADIIICADSKNPVTPNSIYISHKRAGSAKNLNQYGGVSEAAGTETFNHPEVKAFLREVSHEIVKNKLQHPVMSEIKSVRLKNLAIFGPGFGGEFSGQNVQVIGQGKPILSRLTDEKYELSFEDHTAYNGNLAPMMHGGYEPVLGARPAGDRGFSVDGIEYRGVRVMIAPKVYMTQRPTLKVV